jgi:ubiquinone/menaquinone biosynthesis C-methylase UbiE
VIEIKARAMISARLKRSARQKYRGMLARLISRNQERTAEAATVRVLDVGAGNCWLLNLLSEKYTRVGLDMSVNLHGMGDAPEGFLGARQSHFVFGDGTRLPFGDSTFDVVYSNEFVSHVKNIDESLTEQMRVLKTGGLIIIMDANVLNPITFYVCFIGSYLKSRRSTVKRGGVKWLFHRHEPLYGGTALGGTLMAGWRDENIHSPYWWRKKLESYSGNVDFEVSTFWSYLPGSLFGAIANKVLAVGTKL